MKSANQHTVMNRLENESLRAVDKLRSKGYKALLINIAVTKAHLREAVASNYRQDFRGQPWTYPEAKMKGTLARIVSDANFIMERFRQDSMQRAAQTFREVYRETVLRTAWTLDNLTPPSYRARLPKARMFQESAWREAKVYKGPDAETAWKERWSTWTSSYAGSLGANLKLGALNQSSPEDAVQEVDATRSGTPSTDFADALSRIFAYQTILMNAMGQTDVAEANPDMGVERIWQTRYNARVCDICNDNAGLPEEEADDTIPAHPNCECYWRLVPRDWAALLRSGDAADRELARRIDASGKLPTAMLLDNGKGGYKGAVIVEFDQWKEGKPMAVIGQ